MTALTTDCLTYDAKFRDEDDLVQELIDFANLSAGTRAAISAQAADYVRKIRTSAKPGLMEQFLGEYGLSTDEGVALMCLAEALLRVPDSATMDDLIEDKIAPSDWGKHLGQASSSLVNASTWALMLTGRVLDEAGPGMAGTVRALVKRMGEPVIRVAVGQAMREMGRQFVLGETIGGALDRAAKQEARGYTYSYDMLGEAAMTQADADRYARAYADAITAIGKRAKGPNVAENPGISVKLSALHPRYEVAQKARVMAELVPTLTKLARQAALAGIGFNIDAEEQDRLALSLDVIEAVLADDALAGWDGFGVVVQAYGKRAGDVIEWLYATAERLDRKLMVRLVKGAYWDTEIKHAQVAGLPDFPLFTTKPATDVSYIANAKRLIDYTDRLYPQFATHNAHTVAAIRAMAGNAHYEFQRLHGMGERLHDIVLSEGGGRCRIYAPVGAHRDLLAYLVRRLLENGANSSFVNQIVDEDVSPEDIARDPLELLGGEALLAHPSRIFGPDRDNSQGFDLSDETTLARINAARDVALPNAAPLIATGEGTGSIRDIVNPTTGTKIAQVTEADEATVAAALAAAKPWDAAHAGRAAALRRAADLYETNFGPFFAALQREAGKTLADAVGELREAVDFLRYYAGQPEPAGAALGRVTAISPWNFPLAIFTGQIAAALVTGNAVLAKPAEQTPLVASIAVRLLHDAGVPRTALQLLPGDGRVGAALTADKRVKGVVFTGSTDTAKLIQRSMVAHMDPGAPLIAETGGLNAMIVDSTALPEQAVRDIVASAFQSAGQRCSALRCLYVQEDVAETMTRMLIGAMDTLAVGDPWHLSTDVGPVIDAEAQESINSYLATKAGAVLHQIDVPGAGHFVKPTLLRVSGIDDLEREIFGPVLHIATFKSRELPKVIEAINARGFGLTFGLHTRIDSRVEEVANAIHVGNAYVNRNQIGAIVGSQPFGGEGLSGTGPKAGGPNYLPRFRRQAAPSGDHAAEGIKTGRSAIAKGLANFTQAKVHEVELPGPTGELNRLTQITRPPILCLGPGAATQAQAAAVEALGGHALRLPGGVAPDTLTGLAGFSAAMWWGDARTGKALAEALADCDGPIVPLITGMPDTAHVIHERHLCVDTTAAGGNADLLAAVGG